jgi:hypothetical protein
MRMALGRKPYCSRKELPKAMPKEKGKQKAGRPGTVTRVTRIRATGRVNRHVSVAIRDRTRFGTART